MLATSPLIERSPNFVVCDMSIEANNLLVIDDDKAIREAVGDILSLIDVPVLAAKDGRSGIQLYSERGQEVGVVMLDLGLPDMDGIEILGMLREMNPDVKIIVASGQTTPQLAAELSNQSTVYLPKPYNIDGLLGVVESFMDV